MTNENDHLESLTQSDTSKVFVFTDQGKILSVDSQLNVTDTIDYEDLSIYYLRIADLKFIAEIEATTNAFLSGETLYDKRDNSFIAVDLREIIKNE